MSARAHSRRRGTRSRFGVERHLLPSSATMAARWSRSSGVNSRSARASSRRRVGERQEDRGREDHQDARRDQGLRLDDVTERSDQEAESQQDEEEGGRRPGSRPTGPGRRPGEELATSRGPGRRARRRKYPSSRMSDEFTSIERRPRAPGQGRLPRGRARRARVVPRGPARQAGARGGPGGSRQDRAREGRVARDRAQPDPAPVLRGPRRGQGAVRVELPQAAAAHPDRGRRHGLAGGQGRHLRRGLPARPPAAERDHGRGAGRCS